MRFSVLLSSLLLSISLCADAVDVAGDKVAAYDYDTALKLSQSVINTQVGDHVFTNADGEQVKLSDFRGKPLVLSMIYTSCYHICPMTTQYLSKVVEKARDVLGEDSFSVAIVGFDTQVDTPDAMQYFANKQGISHRNWNLLSISKEEVEALSKDIGFIYYPSSNGFDHLIQATIIDADGRVYRQVYGQIFDTPLLVDPLLELVLGRPQPAQSFFSILGDKIKLFCTTYDPLRDGYYYNYSFFVEIFVGITVIVGVIVLKSNLMDKKYLPQRHRGHRESIFIV